MAGGGSLPARLVRSLAAALLMRASWQFAIHTYDLPREFSQGIAEMPLDRQTSPWTTWYDTDQVGMGPHLVHLRSIYKGRRELKGPFKIATGLDVQR